MMRTSEMKVDVSIMKCIDNSLGFVYKKGMSV